MINETELEQLGAGELRRETVGTLRLKDVFCAAQSLRAQGPGLVIVTLGAQGVAVVDGADESFLAASRVAVVDTVAAGDTFCGAFAAATVEGRPLLEAVRFAQGAAALCVMSAGAIPAIPSRAQIELFLSQ